MSRLMKFDDQIRRDHDGGGGEQGLPPLILYSIFQRRIVAGISTTGLAGR